MLDLSTLQVFVVLLAFSAILVNVCFRSAGAVQPEARDRDSRCHIRHHHGLAVCLDVGI